MIFPSTPDSEALVLRCWNNLGRWRSFVLALDGRDGAGKSVLGRYLAYRLNIPCFPTDQFLLRGRGLSYRSALQRMLLQRLAEDRPLLIEGIFVADTLRQIGLKPDYLIRVVQENWYGAEQWQDKFIEYEARVLPDELFVRPTDQN